MRAKDWGRVLPNASTAATLAPSGREREPAAAELLGNFQTSSEAGEEELVGYVAIRAPSGRASTAAAPSAAADSGAAGTPENFPMAGREVSDEEEFEAESVPDSCAFIPGHMPSSRRGSIAG